MHCTFECNWVPNVTANKGTTVVDTVMTVGRNSLMVVCVCRKKLASSLPETRAPDEMMLTRTRDEPMHEQMYELEHGNMNRLDTSYQHSDSIDLDE